MMGFLGLLIVVVAAVSSSVEAGYKSQVVLECKDFCNKKEEEKRTALRENLRTYNEIILPKIGEQVHFRSFYQEGNVEKISQLLSLYNAIISDDESKKNQLSTSLKIVGEESLVTTVVNYYFKNPSLYDTFTSAIPMILLNGGITEDKKPKLLWLNEFGLLMCIQSLKELFTLASMTAWADGEYAMVNLAGAAFNTDIWKITKPVLITTDGERVELSPSNVDGYLSYVEQQCLGNCASTSQSDKRNFLGRMSVYTEYIKRLLEPGKFIANHYKARLPGTFQYIGILLNCYQEIAFPNGKTTNIDIVRSTGKDKLVQSIIKSYFEAPPKDNTNEKPRTLYGVLSDQLIDAIVNDPTDDGGAIRMIHRFTLLMSLQCIEGVFPQGAGTKLVTHTVSADGKQMTMRVRREYLNVDLTKMRGRMRVTLTVAGAGRTVNTQPKATTVAEESGIDVHKQASTTNSLTSIQEPGTQITTTTTTTTKINKDLTTSTTTTTSTQVVPPAQQ